MLKEADYYTTVKRATMLSAVSNAFMSVLKLIIGTFANSSALFADGIHSLSDVLTDIFVVVATRYGCQQADHDHPYGHARIETAAVVGVALLVSFAGLGIFIDAVLHVFEPVSVAHGMMVISVVVAVLSVVINEGLFRYMQWVAKRVDSSLLAANAWHNRIDAVSSMVVLLGLAGSFLGYPWLDAIAAMIVGLLIIKMGCWDLGWTSLRELVDTGLAQEVLTAIEAVILRVPGVRSIHQLRTRSMAGHIILDVHVLVDAYLSVSEGHYIGEQVRVQLTEQMDKVTDVTVHIDLENDESEMLSMQLPARHVIMQILEQHWCHLTGFAASQVTLHYVDGCLYIELHLRLADVREDMDVILSAYRTAIAEVEVIENLAILLVAK